jgi:hypothetical protein
MRPMTRTASLGPAMRAAVDPLTDEQRHVFADETQARFGDPTTMELGDRSHTIERAWQIATSGLLSDPLDPIGEARARFARALFTQ